MQRIMIDMANGVSKHQAVRVTYFSLTAIDVRHIEHSEECEDAVSESLLTPALPRSRSRLCVVTLMILTLAEGP